MNRYRRGKLGLPLFRSKAKRLKDRAFRFYLGKAREPATNKKASASHDTLAFFVNIHALPSGMTPARTEFASGKPGASV
ncbi:hypothetical protein [Rhizobium sp. 22-785-1]